MTRTAFDMGCTIPQRIREGTVHCGFCGQSTRPEEPIAWWPHDKATGTGGFWTGHHCGGQQVVHPAGTPEWREPC